MPSSIATTTTTTPSFDWHPARLLQSQEGPPDDFALLILNQPLKNSVNLRKLWRNCT